MITVELKKCMNYIFCLLIEQHFSLTVFLAIIFASKFKLQLKSFIFGF